MARSRQTACPRRDRSTICSPNGAHSVPVIAAGGLATADDVTRVLGAGAVAAQVGTALLLSDEAGTNAVHRAALQSPRFANTVVTRAFSGRYARGLVNDFVVRFDGLAPPGYPEVNQMTSPIRKAAVAAGNPDGTNIWAGTASAQPVRVPPAISSPSCPQPADRQTR